MLIVVGRLGRASKVVRELVACAPAHCHGSRRPSQINRWGYKPVVDDSLQQIAGEIVGQGLAGRQAQFPHRMKVGARCLAVGGIARYRVLRLNSAEIFVREGGAAVIGVELTVPGKAVSSPKT